jgi:putative acetyltransferase
MLVDDFRPHDQDAVRTLVLRGLADHWGASDGSLNHDLDDIGATYGSGRTVVVRDSADIVATGTLVRRDDATAEIVRMSVDGSRRRSGLGRLVVDQLLATARAWGCARVILETTATWDEVIAFYISCDFAITHHTDGPFGGDVWFERRL